MKNIAKVLGTIVVSVFLIWACGYLYWHFKIIRTIERLEIAAS